jgi:hypothetical protein
VVPITRPQTIRSGEQGQCRIKGSEDRDFTYREVSNMKALVADSIAFLIAAVSLFPVLLFLDLLLNR